MSDFPSEYIIEQVPENHPHIFQKVEEPHGIPVGGEWYNGEEKGIFFVARKQDQVIGGVFFLNRGNSICQLHQLVVAEQYRGKCIGGQLIVKAMQVAKEKGFSEMFLHGRRHVVSLYQRCGFEHIDDELCPSSLDGTCVNIPHEYLHRKL